MFDLEIPVRRTFVHFDSPKSKCKRSQSAPAKYHVARSIAKAQVKATHNKSRKRVRKNKKGAEIRRQEVELRKAVSITRWEILATKLWAASDKERIEQAAAAIDTLQREKTRMAPVHTLTKRQFDNLKCVLGISTRVNAGLIQRRMLRIHKRSVELWMSRVMAKQKEIWPILSVSFLIAKMSEENKIVIVKKHEDNPLVFDFAENMEVTRLKAGILYHFGIPLAAQKLTFLDEPVSEGILSENNVLPGSFLLVEAKPEHADTCSNSDLENPSMC